MTDSGTPDFDMATRHQITAAADIVITRGCGHTCPYVPGRRCENWPIDDPAHASEERVRAIGDDVDLRVRAQLATVLPHPAVRPR